MRRLTAPYAHELKEACARVIDSGRYLHGPETHAFEAELCAQCGTPHAVAVSNGLDALRLMLRASMLCGYLNKCDEILVAANTYIATIMAIEDAGLVPVLVEPDPVGMNIDPIAAERAITPRTRAIMEVHLYGAPCRHAELAEVARRHGLLIFEDNAQAIGAETDGRKTGSLGLAAAFSFYPTKNVGALGDAGAVTTSDTRLANAVCALANYGSDTRYHNIYSGYNCRMDEMQAAMLRIKLAHLADETRRRRLIARIYIDNIHHPDVRLPQWEEGDVWHQFVVRTPRRDALRNHLAQNGVKTDIHYPVPPHRQPCYNDTPMSRLSLPVTEKMAGEVLSLPIATVSPDEARKVAELINKFYR